MTTADLSPASSISSSRPQDRASSARPGSPTARVAGRQNLARAVRTEWLKLRTLRSTWVTSSIAVALTVLFGAGIAVAYAHTDGKQAEAAHVIAAGSSFGQLVVAVLGALAITSEYSSGQIRSSLAAVPRRGRLMVAKALVIAAWSFLIGTAAMFLTWAVSAPLMDGHAKALTDARYLGYFWGVGLSYAGFALMAMGFGLLLRSTAGAITVVMSLLFVIDIPLTLMARQWPWTVHIQGLEPTTTALAVQDPFAIQHTWGSPDTVAFLDHWQAAAVFAAWCLIPMIAGWLRFSRCDA